MKVNLSRCYRVDPNRLVYTTIDFDSSIISEPDPKPDNTIDLYLVSTHTLAFVLVYLHGD